MHSNEIHIVYFEKSLKNFIFTKPSPIFSSSLNYKKGCTRLATSSDKVYQLLAHGRWFSPGTPASFTIKTGRHDIAEKLLKAALNKINQIKSQKIFLKYVLVMSFNYKIIVLTQYLEAYFIITNKTAKILNYLAFQ